MTNFDQGLLSPYTLMGASILANRGNIGQGMIQGGLLSTQMAQQQQKAELGRMQMQAMKDKIAQEAEQKKAQQAFIAQQPQQVQDYFNAFPGQAGPMLGNQLFPESPQLPTGMRMGQNGPEWIPEYVKGKQQMNSAGATNIKNVVGGQMPYKIPAGYMAKDPLNPQSGVMPIPGGPESPEGLKAKITAQGEITPQAKKEAAQKRVTDTLTEVADLYNTLNKMGAAVNVENSTVENIYASLQASDIGQAVQRFAGTDAQSIRNQINQARPTLINYVRQASEMGAKGMDSEKELEFFLQAVSDPKRDIQSNMAALKMLDDAYGLGLTDFTVDQSIMDQLKAEAKSSLVSVDIMQAAQQELMRRQGK